MPSRHPASSSIASPGPYYAEAAAWLHEGAADCATIDACCARPAAFAWGLRTDGHDRPRRQFRRHQLGLAGLFSTTRAFASLLQRELVDAGFPRQRAGAALRLPRGRRAPHSLRSEGPSPRRPAKSSPSAATRPTAGPLAERLGAAGQAFIRRRPPTGASPKPAARSSSSPTGAAPPPRRRNRHRQPRSGSTWPRLQQATRLAVAAAEACDPAAWPPPSASCRRRPGSFAPGRRPRPGRHAQSRHARQRSRRRRQSGRLRRRRGRRRHASRGQLPAGGAGLGRPGRPAAIRETLVNLGRAYGEDRYRISPSSNSAFCRKAFHD